MTVPKRLEFWPDYSGVLLHAAGLPVSLGELPLPEDVIDQAAGWVAQYDDAKLPFGERHDEQWIAEVPALFQVIRSALAEHRIALDDWEGIWEQETSHHQDAGDIRER